MNVRLIGVFKRFSSKTLRGLKTDEFKFISVLQKAAFWL